MFHLKNFGLFGGDLAMYADLDGYVPEPGDRQEFFRYPAGHEGGQEEWTDFCLAAQSATEEAELAVQAWRERS